VGAAASTCRADFTIKIFDQFGNKLTYPFYNNVTDVVVEKFAPTTGTPIYGDPFPHTEKPIQVPRNLFDNGEMKDAAALPMFPAIPRTTLDPTDQQKWNQFMYRIPVTAPNWDNAFATAVSAGLPMDCEAVQSIWVWGHPVTPKYVRKFQFKKVDHDADAAKNTDTASP
jgi:hypothetical protein